MAGSVVRTPQARAKASGVWLASAECGRWRVVVLAPVVDDDAGFGEAAELLDVEQLVADAAVEGLHEGFCHGAPGSMNAVSVAAEAAPVSERVRGQLGAVVAAHMRGRAALAGEPLEHGDGLVGVDAVARRASRAPRG